MTQGKPDTTEISTPATPETMMGSATETHGVNTNLDPNMQGGPVTGADEAKTEQITEQHAEAQE